MQPEVQPEFHWPPGWGPKFCDSVVTHERETVRELDHPTRFGWSAVSSALSFYQNWLLLEEPGGGTPAIFHEAARGPAARLGWAARAELTRSSDTRP